MLIFEDYCTGPGHERRDLKYAQDMTDDIRRNIDLLLPRVNLLLTVMAADGVPIEIDPATGSPSHSGWRPPEVNAATPNAATRSKHMDGLADDLYDPEGALDDWCMNHQARLADIGLWLEHPASTKGWCHVQCVPPKSGNRVFYP